MKKIALSLLLLIALTGCGNQAANNQATKAEPQNSPEANASVNPSDNSGKVVLSSEPADGTFLVTNILDGDTIEIEYFRGKETVRLLGIDSPESASKNDYIKCLGEKAKEKLQEKLLGKKVKLRVDKLSGVVDQSGRLLRYVLNDDNMMVNAEMVLDGYATAFSTYPFDYRDKFLDLQEMARKNKAGLWDDTLCAEFKKK